MSRINYTCKKCNWKASVPVEWADLKPKRCANKKAKCTTSFLKNPEHLHIEYPKKNETETTQVSKASENGTADVSRSLPGKNYGLQTKRAAESQGESS